MLSTNTSNQSLLSPHSHLSSMIFENTDSHHFSHLKNMICDTKTEKKMSMNFSQRYLKNLDASQKTNEDPTMKLYYFETLNFDSVQLESPQTNETNNFDKFNKNKNKLLKQKQIYYRNNSSALGRDVSTPRFTL